MDEPETAESNPTSNVKINHYSCHLRASSVHPPGWIFVGGPGECGPGECGPGECGPTFNENKLLGVGVVVIFHPGTSTVTFLLHISTQGLFLSGPWCTLPTFSWSSSPTPSVVL